MTIHRLGPNGDAKESHTVDLGRVIVTIDDLQALLEQLRGVAPVEVDRDRGVVGDNLELKIEFNGGYCTEPDDLRRLSDHEVTTIWITSPTVQVILSPMRAIAVGAEKSAHDIHARWAKARRTNRRPRLSGIDDSLKVQTIGLAALGLVGLFVIAVLVIAGQHPVLAQLLHISSGWNKATATFFALSCMVSSVYMIRLVLYGSRSYAVVEPLTWDEYRSRQAINKYPRLSYLLGTAALVVTTVLSVLVALLKP